MCCVVVVAADGPLYELDASPPVFTTSSWSLGWPALVSQPLLWLLDAHLAVLPSIVLHVRNPHDYHKDLKEEIELYTR